MAANATATTPAQDLGTVLGLRGSSIVWGRVLAFFLAWMLCSTPSAVYFATRFGGTAQFSYWGSYLLLEFFSSLLLTALLIVSLRNIRGDIGAIVVAAVAYTLLMPAVRLLSRPGMSALRVSYSPMVVAQSFFGPLFILLGIALALRHLRPQWLAIAVGALAGFALSSLSPMLMSLPSMLSRPTLSGFIPSPQLLVTDLASAALFTLIFQGVSGLME